MVSQGYSTGRPGGSSSQDILRAFHALWSLDGRRFYLVNQAFMILLRKKIDAATVGTIDLLV